MKRRPLPAVREETHKQWRCCESDWLVYTLVAAVGALCYANSLNGEFVHDDIPAVVANKDVTGENPIYSVFVNDFWGTPMSDPASHKSYRPLTTLSFRLNYALCGLCPWGWHACNVVLHAACCALVARAAARVARLRRPFAALAALLFAVHPVHTEAVAGVVGRADVLACVFFLSSILVYHGCSGGRQQVWRSCALAALGVLAKETGLAALLVNAALDLHRSWAASAKNGTRWRWGREGLMGRAARLAAALTLVAGVRLALLHGALPAFSPQDNPPAFHPQLLVRVMTFCYLAAFNWWLLLSPWPLSHDWQLGSVPLLTSAADPRNLLTGAALLALLALAYRCITDLELVRHTPAVVGLVLLVVPYLPASNLFVTVGFVIAERVLYIPSVGSVIITVYGLQLLWQRGGPRTPLVVGVALLVAGGVARTHLRNRDWRTRETLLRADLAVLPHNAKLHYNYANFLKDGEQQENAIRHYKEALRLWPSYASAHNNLGTLVTTPQAEYHFLQALRYNARHINAHYNLAKLYRKRNRVSDSLRMLERCLELEPRFVPAYLELLTLRPLSQRRELLAKLLELEPRNADHRLLYGNWLKASDSALLGFARVYCRIVLQMSRPTGMKIHSLKYYLEAMRLAFRNRSSEITDRSDLVALRMSCLVLRDLGQSARVLQLITRWQAHRGGSGGAVNLYLQEWRRRTELAGRAQLYSRAHTNTMTTTCFHHTQLEVPPYLQPEIEASQACDSCERPSKPPGDCQKPTRPLSISTHYKPTHNKSEAGDKQKSCPKNWHKNKVNKMKEPDKIIAPYIPEHLIKTY